MLKHSIRRCFNVAMSKPKKRNRNIQSLSSLGQYNFSNFPPPNKCVLSNTNPLRSREDLFGEVIDEEYSPPFYKPEYDPTEKQIFPPFYRRSWVSKSTPRATIKSSIDTDSITSGVNDIKLIKSLSSSPSWSDDNDIDGSRKVQDELERMDRVLRGIDPIPLHYDMDEYKQWMETFPNLSLFGRTECGPYKIWKKCTDNDTADELCETKYSITNNRCAAANLKEYKEEIKKAVIHNIYENISIRLNNGSSSPKQNHKQKKSNRICDVNKTQTYLSDCLKNSPFTRIINEKYNKDCFISRHCSQEDKVEESPRFESLPLVFENPIKYMEPTLVKKKTELLNGLSRRKSRKSIVLPPIESNRLHSFNQFRSISATPTYSSLLSAKTMKLEKKLLSGKSRNISQK